MKLFLGYFVITALSVALGPIGVLCVGHAIHRNSTQNRIIVMRLSYFFFEQEDHFFASTLHFGFYIWTICTELAGAASWLIMTTEHVCSFFSITRHRLEHLIPRITSSENHREFLDSFHRNIVDAVNLQDRFPYRLVNLLEETACIFFIIVQVTCIVMITTQFYAVSNYYTGCNGFLLLQNWFGQRIINLTEELQAVVNSINWYSLNAQERKELLPILVQVQRPCYLTSGKISILCLETYSELMKVCMSYFTALVTLTGVDNE
ncbi:hypothetical protein QAD02_022853 [Eretmocerus hayati]|uniref:Uncharacterized protein n=1 Tax=Eretmocerus hayati TaxID=131215 RepID=A0ACC2PUT8_9HYME|nr:hypothetical protein QAD02_022853 [Eretmocerus hayati]